MVRPIKKMCAFALALGLACTAVSVPVTAGTAESKSDPRWQMSDNMITVVDPIYTDECFVSGEEKAAFVENGRFYGNVSVATNIVFVDRDGNKAILSNDNGNGEKLFDEIYPVISDYRVYANVLKLVKGDKSTFVNFDGEYVGGKADYYNYAEPLSENAILVSDDGVSYKIINKSGKVTVDNIVNRKVGWNSVKRNNHIYIYCNGGCYIVDNDGNLIMKFDEEVKDNNYVEGEFDIVKRLSDGKFFFIDVNGKVIKELDNGTENITMYGYNNYIEYGQYKQENGQSVYKYYVEDVLNKKIVSETYSYPRIEMEDNLAIGEINKGVTSVYDMNGNVYIKDLDDYCRQLISAEGYVSNDGSEINTDKYFYLAENKFIVDIRYSADNAVTYVQELGADGKLGKIVRFEGTFRESYDDYIVIGDMNGFLEGIYTLDGKLHIDLKGNSYQGAFYLGVGDILFEVYGYDEYGYKEEYITISGEAKTGYSWVYNVGQFVFIEDNDEISYVYNSKNQLVYKGKDVSCDWLYMTYEKDLKPMFKVKDYNNNETYIYDENGTLLISGKNINVYGFSNLLLFEDSYIRKYGAIRLSDNIAIENAEVKLSNDKYTYDGKAKTPAVVSVKVDGVVLTEGKDYKVSYKNNTNVGKATVVVTGKGDYKGTCNVAFEIVAGNGMQKGSDGKWYYYTNGKVDTSYTGLAKNSYGWWYINKGKLDTSYTGMAKNQYGWWYVKNGKLDKSYTGMAKNQYGWFYMKNGKLDQSYTGMAKNEYGWWYMKNGKLDQSYTGMAKNQYGWFYMKNGKLDQSYTGMAKNQYGWFYMKNGKLDQSYTGMAKNQYGWFYMKNGKLDQSYTGLGKNAYGTWYMKNGKLDTKFSGKVTIGGKNYTIKNGKVV